MENSKVFTDESIDQLIADSDFSRFIKVFGLPYSAADLDLGIENLLRACQLVSTEVRAFPKLDESICLLTKNKLRLEQLQSKNSAIKLVPKDAQYSCLLAYNRVIETEKLGLALVLVAMFLGDYHPKTLIQVLSKHVKRDPLTNLSFRGDFQVQKAIERAKLQSLKALHYLVEGTTRSLYDQLQAHFTRLFDIHDLQRKRLLLTHSRFSKERLIEACSHIQERVGQGDGAAICELLSLHLNCPPFLLPALPCWPQPGAFHWLSVQDGLVYTNRSMFLPKGRVSLDPKESAVEWYLEKPLAQVLKDPLEKALVANREAKNLGDLLGVSEKAINREFPELTDLRNRLGIEGALRYGDDVLAAFAFSDPRLLSRGPAYYQKVAQRDAVQLFCSVLESFGIAMTAPQADSTLSFGSLAHVEEKVVANAWSALVTKVENLRLKRFDDWMDIVEYHNAYVITVAFLCSIGFALRPALEYPVRRCSLGADYLVLNDKESHDVTEFSEVPFGQTLKIQLDFYIKHLKQLRVKARNLECSTAIAQGISKVAGEGSSEPLLFRIIRKGLHPVGSADINSALRELGFDLPPNFGRHLIQSALAGSSRVAKNKVSRHGSIFLSSNNAGVHLSPDHASSNVIHRTEGLFKRLGVVPVSGIEA